jgi:type I restriction enzyme S subunit
MTALVAENLPLLAEAPGGIQKLRQLVLELAVRGLLVQQDAGDESARQQIELLAQGKTSASGKRSQKHTEPTDSEFYKSHSIPIGWQWCKLSDIVEILNGRAYKKEELLDAGTPVLRVGNLFTSNHWYYSDLVLDENKYCEAGDLIFAWSASFGPFIWSGERVIFHYHIWKLRPHDDAAVSKQFLHLFLQERTHAIKAAGHGVSMAHMTKEKMEVLPVALPPLAEQHRIVAKVDELMALCDRLEARQQDAEAAHARLVQALLDSLTQARDAEEFQAAWERVAESFPTIFTTDGAIAALRRSILRCGVSGRLTKRSSTDKSAQELLLDAAAIRARLASPGRAWTLEDVESASHADLAFDIPKSWAVVRAAEICWPITSGSTPPASEMHESNGVPFLKVYNIRNQEINFEHKPQFVKKSYHDTKIKRSCLQPGDIVMNIVGPPLGKIAVIPSHFPEWNCNQAIVGFRLVPPMVPAYFYLYLCEGSFLQGIELIGTAGQDNISVTKSKHIPIPVPPAEEQHRIVAKVTELLALCDQLKARIAAARAKHAQLAEALVKQAVEG